MQLSTEGLASGQSIVRLDDLCLTLVEAKMAMTFITAEAQAQVQAQVVVLRKVMCMCLHLL